MSLMSIYRWYIWKELAICIMLFLVGQAPAQLSQYKYTTYTTDNDLPDNGVMQIAQDKTGNLWLATRNGLSRYDGTLFKNYYHLPGDSGGLRSNWITDLATDSDGNLWVSTEWGLCYYNAATDHFRYIHPASSFDILYKAPLLYTGGNTLWMATGSGLKKIDTHHKTWQSTALANIPDPQSIALDGQQCIWIATRGSGLYLYDVHKNRYQHLMLPELPADADLMDLQADGNTLWAATSEGLLEINGVTLQAKLHTGFAGKPTLKGNKLMCLTRFAPLTGDSLLLCGTYDKKLLLFNKRSRLFTEALTSDKNKLFNIPAAIFNSFYADSSILWMGTDAGLCKLNLHQQEMNTYLLPVGANANDGKLFVKGMIPDGNSPSNYWLLTGPSSQLIRYNVAQHKAISRLTLPQNGDKPVAVLQLNQKSLWTVQQHAVLHFDTNGKLLKQYNCSKTITCATFDKQQTMWLGTESGIASLDINTGTIKVFDYHFIGTQVENQSSTLTFPVSGLVADDHHCLWLACIKYGLFSFDTETAQFTAYRQPFHAIYETKNRCSSVCFGDDGLLWVGNMAGISSFDTATQYFTNYNRDSGLLSSYVYAVSSGPQGKIWGRGNTGVFCYQPVARRFTHYSLPVAFSTDMIFQNISVNGEHAYLGFQGGFARFNPPETNHPVPLPVQVTDVTVLNKRLPLQVGASQPLQLGYDQNVIAITFAATDFNDQAVSYEYRMEGMQSTWMDAGKQRTVLFPALHPGKYVFEVRCKQADSTQAAPVTAFAFIIHPPFWKTAAFQAATGLLLLAIAGLFIYKKLGEIKRREKEKIARVREHAELEMKALRSQMNPHFIFNALNSIHRYVLGNRQEAASEYLVKFSKLMRQVLENSQQKLITIEEELQALSLYIELEHRRTADKFSYIIKVEKSVDQAHWMIPPLLLQPYVENAIWHGLNEKEEKGRLEVSVYTQSNLLCCRVEDDGVGREATGGRQKMLFKKISLGSNISSARIRWLRQYNGENATVQIIDKRGEDGKATGTSVLLTLPIIPKEKPTAEAPFD